MNIDEINDAIASWMPPNWQVFQIFNNDDFNAAFKDQPPPVQPEGGMMVQLRHLPTGMLAMGSGDSLGAAFSDALDKIDQVRA